MRIRKYIVQALNDRLANFSSGAYANAKKIAWEGGTLAPPTNTSWLVQKTLWAPPFLIGAFSQAGTYREQGIYQIIVCTPLGQGVIVGCEIADALCEWYPRGGQYSTNDVVTKVEKSYTGTGWEESPHFKIPVSIEFWAYAQYNT